MGICHKIPRLVGWMINGFKPGYLSLPWLQGCGGLAYNNHLLVTLWLSRQVAYGHGILYFTQGVATAGSGYLWCQPRTCETSKWLITLNNKSWNSGAITISEIYRCPFTLVSAYEFKIYNLEILSFTSKKRPFYYTAGYTYFLTNSNTTYCTRRPS